MSAIDGETVNFHSDPLWLGCVLDDATEPGWVRVQWQRPDRFIGYHRVGDLVVCQ